MNSRTADAPDREATSAQAAFRVLGMENEFEMVTAGIDIGSATSHLLFSKILMRKVGTRYVAARSTPLHQSAVLLTPYVADETIDGQALAEFVTNQYAAAGLRISDITAGVVILTGVALSRRNSREIAERLSIDGGRFLGVSAGDNLEAVLSAHGGGSVRLSGERGERVLHLDIGGGTTKLTVCDRGQVLDTAALDVGARLIVLDGDGRVLRIEPAGRRIAELLGLPLSVGSTLSGGEARRLARFMVDQVIAAAGIDHAEPAGEAAAGSGTACGPDAAGVAHATLLRTPALRQRGGFSLITVAGGVAEYFYGRQCEAFGDLGAPLADELGGRLRELQISVASGSSGIRATVAGASQYASQVSGSTIFLSDPGMMPVRNVPVVLPEFELLDDLSAEKVAADVEHAVTRFGLADWPGAVAIAFRWDGSPTYARLGALARGLVDGYQAVAEPADRPLILICDEDVAALLGRHIVQELGVRRPVIAVDGIELRPFDFIDIGATVTGTGAVPVVIKSLLFPGG